jgi:DNA polymerase III subunit epsilon
MQSFSAIDFETATGYQNSACAVGIVTVENGRIIDEYFSLIQPPGNEFWWQNIRVHGITPQHTRKAPDFSEIYPEIKKRLKGRIVVAHNESFDRNVLKKTMNYYYLDYTELQLPERWECTFKIYKAKGFKPTNLHVCCQKMGIDLIHHEALSDARAAAKLYLLK